MPQDSPPVGLPPQASTAARRWLMGAARDRLARRQRDGPLGALGVGQQAWGDRAGPRGVASCQRARSFYGGRPDARPAGASAVLLHTREPRRTRRGARPRAHAAEDLRAVPQAGGFCQRLGAVRSLEDRRGLPGVTLVRDDDGREARASARHLRPDPPLRRRRRAALQRRHHRLAIARRRQRRTPIAGRAAERHAGARAARRPTCSAARCSHPAI